MVDVNRFMHNFVGVSGDHILLVGKEVIIIDTVPCY
jgi:hypothetical protein